MPIVINDFDVVVDDSEEEPPEEEGPSPERAGRLRPIDVVRIVERHERRRLRVRAH